MPLGGVDGHERARLAVHAQHTLNLHLLRPLVAPHPPPSPLLCSSLYHNTATSISEVADHRTRQQTLCVCSLPTPEDTWDYVMNPTIEESDIRDRPSGSGMPLAPQKTAIIALQACLFSSIVTLKSKSV